MVRKHGADSENVAECLLRLYVARPTDALLDASEALEQFEPHRVIVDGLSSMERGVIEQVYFDFVVGIAALVKKGKLVSLLTSTTANLLGGSRSRKLISPPSPMSSFSCVTPRSTAW